MNARQRRDVVQGWDLIIGNQVTIGGHMRDIKTRPFASGRFFTRILMRSQIIGPARC